MTTRKKIKTKAVPKEKNKAKCELTFDGTIVFYVVILICAGFAVHNGLVSFDVLKFLEIAIGHWHIFKKVSLSFRLVFTT